VPIHKWFFGDTDVYHFKAVVMTGLKHLTRIGAPW